MIGFLGTGHYLPKTLRTNADWAKMVETSDEWIVSRTGIHERHLVSEGESNLTMSIEAAKLAMQRANVAPEDLGMVICATLSADNVCPTLAGELIREFDISCPAFDINAACSGFLFAVSVALNMIKDKPVLVVATEMMSRMFDPEDRATCVLFGDGSGAVVLGELEGDSGILAHQIMSYPDVKGSLAISGINHMEDGKLSPSYVKMNGQETYKFATRVLAKNIRETLEKEGMTPEDVTWFVPHQANIRIVETAAKLLKMPMDRFFINIDHTGNTSCASVIIALDELQEQKGLKKGDIIVMTTFGGGLTAATMIVRW